MESSPVSDQRRKKIAEFIMKTQNLDDVSAAFEKFNISLESFTKDSNINTTQGTDEIMSNDIDVDGSIYSAKNEQAAAENIFKTSFKISSSNLTFELNNFSSKCWFQQEFQSIEGYCTYYGACRVDNQDYMYQGGCEHLSEWGMKTIKSKKKIRCKVQVKKPERIFGKCDSFGNCVSDNMLRKDESPQCLLSKFHLLKKKNNIDLQNKFLPTLYKFLGGLGNALQFIYIKFTYL